MAASEWDEAASRWENSFAGEATPGGEPGPATGLPQPQATGLGPQVRGLATKPADWLRQQGTLGELAAYLVPETPEGWAMLTAGLAMGGPAAGLLPFLQRAAVMGTIGITGKALTGQKSPVISGAREGLEFATGEKFLGGATRLTADVISKMARGASRAWTDNVAATLTKYIPGMPKGLQGSKLYDYIQKGGIQDAISSFYERQEKAILQALPANMQFGHPTILRILGKYFPDDVGQKIALPAKKAFELTKLLGEDLRGIAEKKGESRLITSRDYEAVNEALATEIARFGGQDLGQLFGNMKATYSKGKLLENMLHQEKRGIFTQTPWGEPGFNFSSLENLTHEYGADLARQGMDDVAKAFLRGAPSGAASTRMPIPFMSRTHGGIGGANVSLFGHAPALTIPAVPKGLPIPPVSPPVMGTVMQKLMEALLGNEQPPGPAIP